MIVVDDHLLRQLLVRRPPPELSPFLDEHVIATTNLYYARLCRSVATAERTDRLAGVASPVTRIDLAGALQQLPDDIVITPIRAMAWAMAQLAGEHRLSLLGAEAVIAAAHLDATLCVASTDDGPGIRAAAEAVGVPYVVIEAA